MGGSRKGFIPEIDALRATAVLAVMLYHLRASWLPGGFAGVDVFFVISGYVISRSMTELGGESFWRFATAFYARRVRRILPALLVFLVCTAAVSTLFIPKAWLSNANNDTGRYAFFGLSNWYLIQSADNSYFNPQIEFNPYAHTWSLGVEEQFYLIFPILFYLWLHRPAWRRASRTALALATLASLVYCAVVTRSDAVMAYYALPSRLWELAAGTLLYQRHLQVQTGPVSRIWLWAGLALTAAAFVFTDTEHFPFPWALAAVVGTVCIIRSVADTPVPWLRPLAGIGAISYSLYLWHYPVYVLLRWTAGLNTPLEMSAAVLLTFGLALASYRLVEQPFRHRGRGLQPALVMAIGVACAVLSWGFATQIIVHRYRLSLSTVTHNAPEWYPAPWGSQSDNGPCHITFTVETKWPPDSRLYASRGHCPARRMLFVSGNSHALAYSQMLGRFTLEQPYDVRIYYHPACAFMNLDHPMVSDEDSACRQFYTDVENELKAFAGRGDVVFLPSLRLPRFGDQWTLYDRPDLYDKRSQAERKAQREAAVQEAEDLVASLAARGVRVVIEAPKPIFRAPAFRCADWYERTNPICAAGTHMPRTELIAYRQPVVRAMAAIRGAEVWDPFDLLCPGNPCGVTSAGHPLYFDGDHVSGYANERLYPSFLQAIAGNAALRGATRPPQHP